MAFGRARERAGARGRADAGRPSALRAIPAETTAAKVKDPNWKAPRTAWGHPDLEGTWSSDDMRGIPTSRPPAQGTRESLTPEEFARRAGGDEASRDRAVNQETFLRNEFGVRTFGYTSFVVEPADGRLPALTPAGLARQKASFGVGTFGTRPVQRLRGLHAVRPLHHARRRRRLPGALRQRPAASRRRPNEVVISYEMVHDTRVIPLDGRPHVGAGDQAVHGQRARPLGRRHAGGRDDELHRPRRLPAAPNSEGLKLTEWFTRIDPQMIDYRDRVEDPAMYTAPFTMRFTITQQPNYELYEYSCHEGNGAVGNALSGERAYERPVAEAKAKGLPVPPRTMGMEVYSGQAVEGVQPVREIGFGK